MANISPISTPVNLPTTPASTQDFAPLFASQTGFEAPNLDQLTFVEYLHGLDGGVTVYIDTNTEKKYTVKAWKNRDHAINEVIASEIFQLLGTNTPKAAIYNDLPGRFKREGEGKSDSRFENGNGQNNEKATLFRIAEFIEGEHPGQGESPQLLSKDYVNLAFLNSHDSHNGNVLVTAEGEAYLVDVGSALFFHPLGERHKENRVGGYRSQPWSAFQITEFKRFEEDKSIYHPSRPDEETITQSLHNISEKAHEILKLASDLADLLAYRERTGLLEMLGARIQHAQLLLQTQNGYLNLTAERDMKAGAFDAAGVLAHTKINDETHFLIGKRNNQIGNGTWVCLGGESDPNETIDISAAREVFEESAQKISITPQTLAQSPAHDLLTKDDDGTFKRFRTYLTETNYVPAEDIKDHEYAAYHWISLSDLQKASENGGEFNVGESTETLFKPFHTALQTEQIASWLDALSKGNPIKATCTQSIAGSDLRSTEDALQARPFARNARIAAHLVDRAPYIQILRAELDPLFRYRTNGLHRRKVTQKELASADAQGTPLTASHQALARLYPEQNDMDQQVRSAIAKATHISPEDVSQDQIDLAHQIITKEVEHPDAHFAYHGTRVDILVNYYALSYIRHFLEGTNLQIDVLRSLDAFFEKYPDAKALQDYVSEGKSNYSADYHGLSCNPTLFSNLNRPSSSTLAYFLNGNSQTPPANIWAILESFLKSLKMPTTQIMAALQDIYQTHFEDKKGALMQFMIEDDELLNRSTYVSAAGGHLLHDPDTDDKAHITDTAAILAKLRAGEDIQLSKNHSNDNVQLRVHPAFMRHATVNTYFADGSTGEAGEALIRDALEPYLKNILIALSTNTDAYKEPVALQKAYRLLTETRSFERDVPTHPIWKAWLEKDIKEVFKIVADEPEAIYEKYIDPNSLYENTLKNVTYLKAFAEKEKDERFSIINHIQNLFSEDMEHNHRVAIAETLLKIEEKSKRDLIVKIALDKLFTADISNDEKVAILKALAAIKSEKDIQEIVNLALSLAGEQRKEISTLITTLYKLTDKYDDILVNLMVRPAKEKRARIVKLLAEEDLKITSLSRLADLFRGLFKLEDHLPQKTKIWDGLNLGQHVPKKDLIKAEREILALAKPLIPYMSYDREKMIFTIAQMHDLDKRQQVCALTLSIFAKLTRLGTPTQIIEALAAIGKDKPSWKLHTIPDDREHIVKCALKFARQKDMMIFEPASLIESLARIKEGDKREMIAKSMARLKTNVFAHELLKYISETCHRYDIANICCNIHLLNKINKQKPESMMNSVEIYQFLATSKLDYVKRKKLLDLALKIETESKLEILKGLFKLNAYTDNLDKVVEAALPLLAKLSNRLPGTTFEILEIIRLHYRNGNREKAIAHAIENVTESTEGKEILRILEEAFMSVA